MEFIESRMPPPPGRVLDVGCGGGELANRLRAAGHEVSAIDIDPVYASPTVRTADICSYEDEPFDVVVFSLSLHHVHSLDKAVDRAFALLKPGGTLIVDEFAHERADAAIADRFYGEPGSLEHWRQHHSEFHTGRAMIDAISQRFTIGSLVPVPYLYRYLEDDSLRDFESVLGFHLTAARARTTGAIAGPPTTHSVR
jgi:SAM-dependent methyltransferase